MPDLSMDRIWYSSSLSDKGRWASASVFATTMRLAVGLMPCSVSRPSHACWFNMGAKIMKKKETKKGKGVKIRTLQPSCEIIVLPLHPEN